MKFAERLCRESRWSKATYTYQKAAFLLMCDHQTDDTQAHVEYLFGYANDCYNFMAISEPYTYKSYGVLSCIEQKRMKCCTYLAWYLF